MSDWFVLGLLAAGFYLYECCTWTPAAAFACFRRPLRASWRAASGADLPGNESGGFAFSDPLTLSGNYLLCSDWPLAISPDGFCIDSEDAADFWAFESIRTISVFEKTVRVNGEPAFRVPSEMLAHKLARDLDRVKDLPLAQRADAIRGSIDDSFDASMVQSEWSRFLDSSRALTRLSALPVVWLVVVTPLSMFLLGPLRTWPYLLAGLFLGGLAVSIEFVRVHRHELPHVSDRWLHALSMTLFPIAAIRASDRISKERLSQFHPAAIVGVLCDDAEGDRLLRRIGFDLGRPTARCEDARIESCRRWYQTHKQSAFRELLTALGRSPFAPPEKLDPSMTLYCRRCHSQFADGDQCSDCSDVALSPFVDAVVPAQRARKKRKRA
jgi:hypothetical protein